MPSRKIPWTRQPQQLTPAACSGPLAAGLKYAYSAGGGAAVNAVDNHLSDVSPGGQELTRVRDSCKVWHTSGSSEGFTDLNVSGLTYPFTLFALVSTDTGTTSGFALSIFKMGGGGGGIYLGVGSDYAGTNFPRLSINGTLIEASTKQLVNTARVIASVSYSATSHELFVDGASVGTSSASGPAIDSTFRIGGLYARTVDYGYNSLTENGNLAACGVYDRALTPAEIHKLSANVWQVFSPIAQKRFAQASGGGINGTLAFTTDSVAFAGSGAVSESGTLAFATDGVTFAGVGAETVTGQMAFTTDDIAFDAVGAVPAQQIFGHKRRKTPWRRMEERDAEKEIVLPVLPVVPPVVEDHVEQWIEEWVNRNPEIDISIAQEELRKVMLHRQWSESYIQKLEEKYARIEQENTDMQIALMLFEM